MVRIKERYLLVNIIYPQDPNSPVKASVPDAITQHQPTIEKLSPGVLLKAIRAEVGALFGDYGVGALEGHLSVKYLSLATSTLILRCARAHHQMLWAALFVMDRIPVKDGRPCIFRVVRVSGTMRKAEEEAIRQARRLIIAAKRDAPEPTSCLFPITRDERSPRALLAMKAPGHDSDEAYTNEAAMNDAHLGADDG